MIRILGTGNENRKPGKRVRAGVHIIAGQPVQLDPSDVTGETLMLAAGVTMALGFALETTVPSPDPTRFYDDFARGGLVSYVVGSGIEVEIGDDGRGAPYDTARSYVIGQRLFVNAAGRVSNVVLGDAIGLVTKVPASALDTLRIQLLI